MINAEEAHELYKNSIKSSIPDIEQMIRKAASNGEQRIYWYQKLSDSDKGIIRNSGYALSDLSSQKDGICFLIEW